MSVSMTMSAMCMTMMCSPTMIVYMSVTNNSFYIVVVYSFLIQSKIFLWLISCSRPLKSRVGLIMATVCMAVMIVCVTVISVCVAVVSGFNQWKDEEEGN